jgi:outer membrane protein
LREVNSLGYTLGFAEHHWNPPGSGNDFKQPSWLGTGSFWFAGAHHNKEKKVISRMWTASRSRNNSIRTVALVASGLFSTGAAWAQGSAAAPAAAAAPAKVGVINIRQAIVATAEGKQASAELQSQFAPRQTELENLNKQVNDLRQRLQAGQGKISPDEEARLTKEGQRLAAQLERKNNEYQEDVNASQGDVIDRIGRKMVDVLDRYARENGYSIVLDTSAQNTPILYASNQIDVTQDIIRLFDQQYPIKGAAAPAPKPAAAKPAPTTPTPTKPQQ